MKKIEKDKSIIRFGVSIPYDLIHAFDEYIREREYSNRSEAIRDLIREKLIGQEWEEKEFEGQEVVGIITYVFNHHKRDLVDSIIDIQHDFPDHVIVSQHVHLDHHNCLEVAIVRGEPNALRNLAYKLKALKGVKHCQLTMTTTGTSLS
ncbi:MAG: nickel-responsive transcriptional regulator NikR [Deltaproteobacteria bacterium]|jgi:CopG family nickel-responsive transcriptional regulator|nr:nickel-responsive transcriptional regulator NikR [Deltaproteobacteria bacterium]MDL1961163.1 nickel-responsive transcriptional regulator NikR [Deltaproteobacteria bacterium]